MKDNEHCERSSCRTVVNCFQKLLSSWWRTTNPFETPSSSSLWIAFKNYYLRDEGQLDGGCKAFPDGCELLSKIIIFVMKDNFYTSWSTSSIVVNCFQKLLSSWWRTTAGDVDQMTNLLWIAFKNYYLRDEGQRLWVTQLNQLGCELLSKIIIFVMKDNQ